MLAHNVQMDVSDVFSVIFNDFFGAHEDK